MCGIGVGELVILSGGEVLGVIQIILREITERLKGSSMPRIFSLLLFIFFSL